MPPEQRHDGSLSARLARLGVSPERWRSLRHVAARGAAVLFFGSAMSIGGIAGPPGAWLGRNLTSVQQDSAPAAEGESPTREEIRADFFAEEIPYGDLIHEKARKYDVDPALVAAVIEHESGFAVRARSRRGARGLMQLMPQTGLRMGARNLYDPEQNIDAGVKFIKYLDERFGGDLRKTIAGYNAGEGAVERYHGIPPFKETRRYVRRVLGSYDRRSRQLEAYERERLGKGSVPDEDGTLALR